MSTREASLFKDVLNQNALSKCLWQN